MPEPPDEPILNIVEAQEEEVYHQMYSQAVAIGGAEVGEPKTAKKMSNIATIDLDERIRKASAFGMKM